MTSPPAPRAKNRCGNIQSTSSLDRLTPNKGLMEEPESQYPKNPCQPDIESHEIKGRMAQMGNVCLLPRLRIELDWTQN